VKEQDSFPGERPEHRMRKLPASNALVTCGSCRQFDGVAWCRRWNFHTEAQSPVCDQYRPRKIDGPVDPSAPRSTRE
jgi:hypothetical protein